MGLFTLAQRLWNDVFGNGSVLVPTVSLIDGAGNLIGAGGTGGLINEAAGAAAAVTANITANGQSVTLPMTGYNGAAISWSGVFAGISLNFLASYDGGTTYIAAAAAPVAGGAAVTSLSALSAASAYEVFAPGATHVRVTSTAWTSGTMAVKMVPNVFGSDPTIAVSGGSVQIAVGGNTIGGVTGSTSAGSTGLALVSRLLSAAASTNATSVKSTGTRLYKVKGYNAAAVVRYLKLYNKASAPTVGTDIPVVTLALKPSDAFEIDFGLIGEYFSAGIAYALTTGAPDADTGALTAGDILGLNLWYS